MSGHVAGADGVRRSFAHVFAQPGVSSMIVGTINPEHLRDNVAALDSVLRQGT
jgi:aryl-alcohol dehydrogenase-like predicted oxidoreductase